MRRFQAAAAQAGIEFERVNAVDTRTLALLQSSEMMIEPKALAKLSATLHRGYRLTHEELTLGSVGCALSHVAAAEEATKKSLSMACIFEDDVQLPLDAAQRIGTVVAKASSLVPDWDMLLLGWWDRGGAYVIDGGSPSTSPSMNSSVGPDLVGVGRFWGCHAYVLSSRGMKMLAKINTPVAEQIDSALSSSRLVILGIADHSARFQQAGQGSDVQFPVRIQK